MRITIGGVLLVGGVAAVAVLGPLSGPDNFMKQAFDGVMSLMNGSSSPAPAPKPAVAKPAPVVATAAAPAVSGSAVAASTVTAAQARPPTVVAGEKVTVASAPQPAVAVPVETAVPAKASRRRRRRSRHVKTAAPAATAEPDKSVTQLALPKRKAPATSSPTDALIGKYVAVKLKSGREVKGVLRSRSWEGLTLEIPGMGPFQYPSSNVDGVKAAD